MMTFSFTNFAYGTLSTGIDSDDTSVVLESGEGARFPASTNNWYGVIWDTYYSSWLEAYWNSCAEIVRVTSRTTDTLTVSRAQESTTARSFNASGRTYQINQIVTAAQLISILSTYTP